jgi:hypothetical protein
MAQRLIGLLARHIRLMPEKLGPPGFKKTPAIVSEVQLPLPVACQLVEWAMEMCSEKLTGEASRGSGWG